MSFPVHELRTLLGIDAAPRYGVVVTVRDGDVVVATDAGAVTASSSAALRTGDRVKIIGGVATLAPLPSKTYAV